MLVEQSNFEEYIRIRHIYFEKNSNHRVSVEFRKDMIQLIRLENSNKEECQEYLVKRFKEKFDNDKYVSEYNLSQVISEFYELCLQEEQTNLKNKKETQTFNYNNYSDSGSGSGSGSDSGSDGNRLIDIIIVIKVVHTRAAQVQEVIILIKVVTVQKMFRIKRKK